MSTKFAHRNFVEESTSLYQLPLVLSRVSNNPVVTRSLKIWGQFRKHYGLHIEALFTCLSQLLFSQSLHFTFGRLMVFPRLMTSTKREYLPHFPSYRKSITYPTNTYFGSSQLDCLYRSRSLTFLIGNTYGQLSGFECLP